MVGRGANADAAVKAGPHTHQKQRRISAIALPIWHLEARCLKKATELAPQRIMHRAELAHVYKAMGKSDLALQEWQNILGLRAADSADEKYQQEARATLEAARNARGSSGSRLTTQR